MAMDVHSSEPSTLPDRASTDPDPEAVRRTIRGGGEAIRRRELRRAFDRLETRGTLTDRRRQVLVRMATAIVDGVLAAPDAALADADEHDPETVRRALELFGPDR